MEKKIFWIVFILLGLIADFLLPIWVGPGGDHSYCRCELVGGVSERMVLS